MIKKAGRDCESAARGRHKCPNYLAVGIRSTVIIWTGQRNLGGRRNLRDGRGPPPPRRTARCPNSHSNTPNRPLFCHPRCNTDPTRFLLSSGRSTNTTRENVTPIQRSVRLRPLGWRRRGFCGCTMSFRNFISSRHGDILFENIFQRVSEVL